MQMGKYNAENQNKFLLKNNLLGATSFDELEQLEAVAFSLRSSQLETEGLSWLFPISTESIKRLHYILFQDIYPFAGEIRSVELMKDGTRFCQAIYISKNLRSICLQMEKEEKWKSLEQATQRLAYYKAELNMVHPFREGNGRTIRIIIRELALTHGFEWDFKSVNSQLYKQAMIQSVTDDRLLQEIFLETVLKTK